MKQEIELTDDQRFCVDVLAVYARGHHHLPKVTKWGGGVAINWNGDLATFDFDGLTRLVLLAHANAVRIEIKSSGPGLVKICASRRKPNADGLSMWERHPTAADLIAMASKNWAIESHPAAVFVKPEEKR